MLDENTLEESWYIRLSRLTMFVYVGLFIVATFFILALLIIVTPIKYYLPGYGEGGNREVIITQAMQVDSLQRKMELQEQYLDVLKGIISGDLTVEEVEKVDTFAVLDRKSDFSFQKSEREQQFAESFEEEEKFNLPTIGTTQPNIYVFFRPVRGVVAQHFSLTDDVYGTSIITSPNENVLSVLDGTVIYADFSFYNGWVIQIQHEGNYLSVYKNNTRILKKVGDVVRAGETIAITGDASDKEKHFYFELWNSGSAVNPENLINF